MLQRAIKYLVIVLFLLPYRSGAQIELSNNIDFGYPFLINHYNQNLNYDQISAGLRFGISYKPTNTQFFPTLNFGFGSTRLPIKQFGNNVAIGNYNYLSLILSGNFVVNVGQNTLYMLGGIGFMRFKYRRLGLSGSKAQQMEITLDSTANITKVFPTIGLGFEYVYGASVDRPYYLSMGLSFHYVYLFAGQNDYSFHVDGAQSTTLYLNGALTGHIIYPNLYIALHVLLGNNLIFWHKKSSYYL